MRIDSSGKVGIGTNSPSYALSVNSGSSTVPALLESTGADSFLLLKDTNTTLGNVRLGSASNSLIAYAGGSERMRIDSSGRLLMGRTNDFGSSGYKLQVDFGSTTTGILVASAATASKTALIMHDKNNGSAAGSITYDGLAVQYNTSSDQRLKENIVDSPSASDDIDAIQVRSFDWKADGSHQKYGMVAQELLTVAPEAVSQGATEDEMMGVDYSKLVPMMIKEIQNLRREVAALKENN